MSTKQSKNPKEAWEYKNHQLRPTKEVIYICMLQKVKCVIWSTG